MDSHFQVQLAAVLDVLMKSAVTDICALAESWFKSLQTEIAKSKKENEDLRQKLHIIQQQQQQQQQQEYQQHQTAAEAEVDKKGTKVEEADCEMRDMDDVNAGCTVFAETPTQDLATDVQLWSSASEVSNSSRTESAPSKSGHTRWNRIPVGAKAGKVVRSGKERGRERLNDTSQYDLSAELQNKSEKFQPALQDNYCSRAVRADCENKSEGHAMRDGDCEMDGLRYKREQEEQFDTFLLPPGLQHNAPHLHRENYSGFTNSNCRMSLNKGRDLNLSVISPNAKHLDYSQTAAVSLTSEKEVTFICNICGKNLATKNSLTSHYRLHTGERPFTCTHCGKQFAKKFNLDIHYNIHTGAKPYICTLCPKSFADPSAFRRHKCIHRLKSQQHTKGKFSCTICGKCFLSKPSLAAHFQLHMGEKRHSMQKILYRKLHYKSI